MGRRQLGVLVVGVEIGEGRRGLSFVSVFVVLERGHSETFPSPLSPSFAPGSVMSTH